MLSPIAVQAALRCLLESDDVPADTALIVFSDSGLIYSHVDAVASTSRSSIPSTALKPITESQKLQFARQPGLKSLLGSKQSARSNSRQISSKVEPTGNEEATQSQASDTLPLQLSSDERSKILGAIACQSWIEEINRVRRLFTKIHGHTPGAISDSSAMMRSFSGSTSGAASSNINGKSKIRRLEQNGLSRIEGSVNGSEVLEGQEVDQETVAAPVAVPGTLLQLDEGIQSVAPLLLEGEMGALLVLPLLHKAITSSPASPSLQASAPLLLVLGARSKVTEGADLSRMVGNGESILSQQEWRSLNDAANAFASHIGPALRKAYAREAASPGDRGAMGDAVTVSDMESSAADFDGLAITAQETSSQGYSAGIPVR